MPGPGAGGSRHPLAASGGWRQAGYLRPAVPAPHWSSSLRGLSTQYGLISPYVTRTYRQARLHGGGVGTKGAGLPCRAPPPFQQVMGPRFAARERDGAEPVACAAREDVADAIPTTTEALDALNRRWSDCGAMEDANWSEEASGAGAAGPRVRPSVADSAPWERRSSCNRRLRDAPATR